MRVTRFGKLTIVLLSLCFGLSGISIAVGRQGQDSLRCLTLATLGQRRALTIDIATGHAALDDRTLMLPYKRDTLRSRLLSPDGRYEVGFAATANGSQLVLNFLAGRADPLPLQDPGVWFVSGSWSPDSRHFAFIWNSVWNSVHPFHLKIVNTRSHQFAELELTGDSQIGYAKPVWSPDSRSVAVAYSSLDRNKTDVFRYDIESAQFQVDNLLVRGEAVQAEWSPGGAHLALTVGLDLVQVYIMGRDGAVQKFQGPRRIDARVRFLDVTAFWWLGPERLIVNTIQSGANFEIYGVDGSKAVFAHGAQYLHRWYANVDGGRRVILTVRGDQQQAGPDLLGTLIEVDTETGTQRTLLDSVRLEKSDDANAYDQNVYERFHQNRFDQHRDALLFVQWTEREQAIVMTDLTGRILYRMPITSLPERWYDWSNDNSKVLLVAPGPNGLQRVILRTDGTVLHSSLAAGVVTVNALWLADNQRFFFIGATDQSIYIDLIDVGSQPSIVHRLAEGPSDGSSDESRLIDESDGVLYFARPEGYGYALIDGTPVTLPDLTDVPTWAWVAPDGHAALLTSNGSTKPAPNILRNHQGDKLVWNFSEQLIFAGWSPDSSQFVIISGPISTPVNAYPRWLRVYRADGTLIREGSLSGDVTVDGHRWTECSTDAKSAKSIS